MLRTLSIRDYVIVERLELEFGPGFSVFTGETGAGKSILIDALALVLGQRADATVIRQGAERAEISAEFDLADDGRLRRWLAEQELTGDEGSCLVRRIIDAGGRSRAFINGSPATLAQLREAGEFLVDIHGQHQHQSLLRSMAQRELLDAFAGLEDAATRTRALYREWQTRSERRKAFETNSAAIDAERESLEWQVKELEALAFTVEGWQSLLAEHSRLSHAASLIEGAQYGLEALSEGESSSLSQLNTVLARLNGLLEFDASLQEIIDVLEPAGIQIQEAVYSLRHYQQKLDVDPQRLREAENQVDAVHTACRKYRIEPEDIPVVLARWRSRLAELDAGGDPEALKRLEDDARAAYMAEAQSLSAGRRTAATRLSAEVTAGMQTLAMAGGVFETVLEVLADPAAHGLEQVEFRVAAHKSLPPQPLAKVASGGELSRLSLAIQTVTSQVAQVPTLVFDEVDSGIGGRVAEIVGKMLKQLGHKHQVMCITHLPQVAASADQQWQVAKTTTKAKVSSRVVALDSEQRVDEIARMLGGVKITDTTRKHAAEMLQGSERVSK
ncbi:MAG: repair protein RecN [Betaproteobacteria bacterium]|jgi:DNA repair protein RecN (Recombination protein N)|nr:repair protein RecN [Betaproteobacteria bacterium]